ncbi:carbohydrate ABC transporter permease [Arthrobacter sp. MDT3-24]
MNTRFQPPAAGLRTSRTRRGYLLYLLPGITGLALVVVLPFATNIVLSFTKWAGIGTPTFIGLENFARLLQDGNFWVSFVNSIAMIVAMAIIPTALSLLLAALLYDFIGTKFGPRIASFFRAGFYLPQILPVTVVGILWGWILLPSGGVLNTVLDGAGLGALKSNWLGQPSTALAAVMAVLVWFQVGYCLVIFMAGLSRTDPSLTEAASLDGATWPQRFRHVIVPQLKPEIYVVLLTTTITALKVFGPIFVLTKGGPGNATTVPSYFAWQNFFSKNQIGYGAAISTVMTVLIIVLALVFLKVQSKGQED